MVLGEQAWMRACCHTHIAASGEEKDVVDATATATATAATRAVATAAAAAGWQVLAGVEL